MEGGGGTHWTRMKCAWRASSSDSASGLSTSRPFSNLTLPWVLMMFRCSESRRSSRSESNIAGVIFGWFCPQSTSG